MVHVVEYCTVNSHILSNALRVEVGKFRSEEPLSLWFGNHFLASALQIVTHLHYYFIPSLNLSALWWSSLVTVFRIKQCIVCVCYLWVAGRCKTKNIVDTNQRSSLWLHLNWSVRFIVWAVRVFLTATFPPLWNSCPLLLANMGCIVLSQPPWQFTEEKQYILFGNLKLQFKFWGHIITVCCIVRMMHGGWSTEF